MDIKREMLRVFVEVHRPSEIHIQIVDYLHMMIQAAHGTLTLLWDWKPDTDKHADDDPFLTKEKLREVWRLAVDLIDYELGDEEVMGPINELIQSEAEVLVEKVKMGK